MIGAILSAALIWSADERRR